MATLRSKTAIIHNNLNWHHDNELELFSALGLLNKPGKVRVTNDTGDRLFSYQTVRTNSFGQWDGQPARVNLTPGRTIEHEASSGELFTGHLTIFDWSDVALKSEANPDGVDPPDSPDGRTSTPADKVWDWIEANMWLFVGLAIIAVVVFWLFFAGGAEYLIASAKP